MSKTVGVAVNGSGGLGIVLSAVGLSCIRRGADGSFLSIRVLMVLGTSI
jgi:hypothetical protein